MSALSDAVIIGRERGYRVSLTLGSSKRGNRVLTRVETRPGALGPVAFAAVVDADGGIEYEFLDSTGAWEPVDNMAAAGLDATVLISHVVQFGSFYKAAAAAQEA